MADHILEESNFSSALLDTVATLIVVLDLDVTDQTHLNEQLEQRVLDRTAELAASIRENDAIQAKLNQLLRSSPIVLRSVFSAEKMSLEYRGPV
jgi:hypothetical protein